MNLEPSTSNLPPAIRLLALVSIVAALAFPQRSLAAAGDDEYKLAVGLYNKNNWSLAADSFRKFIKEHPNHPDVPLGRYYLGLTLVNVQEFQEAREVFRGYVKDYPNSKTLSDAMYRVAECSYLLDDLPGAEKEFKAFLAKSPKDALGEWAYPYLADVLLRSSKVQEAADTFKKGVEQYPQGKLVEDAKFGLARCYEALKQPQGAMALYKELASNRAGARAPQAQLNLATLSFDAGDFPTAAAEYVALEKQFPESSLVPLARLNSGFAYFQAGDFEQAAARFALAAETPKQATTANYWKGLSYKSLRDYAKSIDVLKGAYEAEPDGPLAENLLYHWADAELRSDRLESAEGRFLEVVKKWPQGEFADDSLHFAAETALFRALGTKQEAERTALLTDAQQLLDRFGREYPASGLRFHQALVQGRLLELKGGTENLRAAATHFRKVVDGSTLEGTRGSGRFYLARVQQKLGEHEQAVATLGPLVDDVVKTGADSEFAAAAVMLADSQLRLMRDDEAAKASTQYLQLQPNGGNADEALGIRAVANARLKKKEAAQADLDRLVQEFASTAQLPFTTHSLAEIAYAQMDWEWSAKLFGTLEGMSRGTPNHPVALAGLGWSDYRQEKHKAAAASFLKLANDYPKHELAAEAAYQAGISLEKDGQLEKAADQYAAAFKSHTTTKDGFLAGLQLGRVFGRLGKTDEADAAYEALLKAHPQADGRLDFTLNEWALLNYEAKRFERADEIFRRLVAETPGSKLAYDARYVLAESDLLAGRIDAAKKAFQDLRSDAKAPPEVEQIQQEALYRLIGIAAEENKWGEVSALCGELLQRFSEGSRRWDARFHTVQAQLHLEKAADAKQTVLALIAEQDRPEVSEASWFQSLWVQLAEAQFRLKEYKEATATVEEFEKRFPASPILYQAYEVLGRTYKQQAKFDEARAAFRKVTASEQGRRTETAAKSQLFLADTYFFQKDYRSALKEFLAVDVLYDFPEYQAPALFQAALCHELLDEWTQAVKSYEDLLKRFSQSEKAKEAMPRLEAARKRAGAN